MVAELLAHRAGTPLLQRTVPKSTLSDYAKLFKDVSDDDLAAAMERDMPVLGGNTRRYLNDDQVTLFLTGQEAALAQFIEQRFELDSCIHPLAARQKAQQLGNLADLPTESFLTGFLERHPTLSARCGQPLSEARHRSFTEESLKDADKKLKEVMRKHKIKEAYQVAVMDETNQPMDKFKSRRALGNRSARGFSVRQPGGEGAKKVSLLPTRLWQREVCHSMRYL
jgi:hypothetical protein